MPRPRRATHWWTTTEAGPSVDGPCSCTRKFSSRRAKILPPSRSLGRPTGPTRSCSTERVDDQICKCAQRECGSAPNLKVWLADPCARPARSMDRDPARVHCTGGIARRVQVDGAHWVCAHWSGRLRLTRAVQRRPSPIFPDPGENEPCVKILAGPPGWPRPVTTGQLDRQFLVCALRAFDRPLLSERPPAGHVGQKFTKLVQRSPRDRLRPPPRGPAREQIFTFLKIAIHRSLDRARPLGGRVDACCISRLHTVRPAGAGRDIAPGQPAGTLRVLYRSGVVGLGTQRRVLPGASDWLQCARRDYGRVRLGTHLVRFAYSARQ